VELAAGGVPAAETYAGVVSSQENPKHPGRFDFDAFAELYDDATIDAIEQETGEPYNVVARPGDDRSSGQPPTRGARGSNNIAAVGMLTAGLFRGVDAALDPEDKEPIVDFIDEDRSDRDQAVSVYLVPGNPKASVAIVRHWLL
jgi:hypothetical protein